jgi:hypothetical protein
MEGVVVLRFTKEKNLSARFSAIAWSLAIFGFTFVCTSGALAQPNQALVLGSYFNDQYAQQRLAELKQSLDLPLSLIAVESSAKTRFRIVTPAKSAQELTTAREAAAAIGITDAWVTTLSFNTTRTTTVAIQKPEPATSSIAAQSASQPPTPETVVAPASTTAESTVSTVSPVAKIASIELSTEGTEVEILVPEFAEGEFDFKLDGIPDEPFWNTIPSYDNMLVTTPDTMVQPRFNTTMRWFYTDKGMYIAVHMEQPTESLLARLSSRDEFLNRDSWGITLDTSGEGLYGYWFTVNLGGSVMDGKVAAERQYSNEWDGPWESATATADNGWTTEMFLPWSMMTMPDSADGHRNFGFFVNRKVAYLDERWSWPALPFTSTTFMSVLGQMQTPGVEPKRQLELYPNISYTLDEINSEDEYRAGLDLSWRPSSNIQVTATLNPDFGVVESDDVVINLSSFETFFPEKRLFFLEGREVFQTTPRSRVRGRGPSGTGSRQTTSTFNPEPTTLLNTRRIGGTPRVTIPDNVDVAGIERGKPSDLLGAVKLTGQTGPLRYGLLSAFEDDVRLPGTLNSGPNIGQATRVEAEGRDFGVARLLYETTGAGRQSIGYLGTVVSYEDYDAIVHGVDGHWLSPNGLWQVDGQFIKSDVDDVTGDGYLADVKFKPKQGVEHNLTLDWLDENLDVRDLGFIRRNDSRNIIYRYSYTTGRGLKRLRAKNRSAVLSSEWNQDGRHVRGGLFFRNGWTFKNLNEIRTEFDYFPARWDDRNSFGNGDFKVDDRVVAEIAFGTDTSKQLSFSALVGMRQEELSDWSLRSALGVTYKPNDRFSIDFDLNYFDRKGWLLHQFGYGRSDSTMDRNMTTFDGQEFQPRLAMDLFLSAKQQLRLTLQWAGINMSESDHYLIPLNDGELIPVSRTLGEPHNDFTVSRMTAQLRYRWELGPLSDLFVVYTRGSNLPDRVDDEFSDLFADALDQPVVDLFVIKLRYRFGL